jgi:hypothetical protein
MLQMKIFNTARGIHFIDYFGLNGNTTQIYGRAYVHHIPEEERTKMTGSQ